MSQTEVAAQQPPRSFGKGILAGLVGGLAGAVAKTLAERMFPPRTHGEPEPTETGPIRHYPETAAISAESIDWAFGAAVGAAYGALAEYYPAATGKEGASFGMALEALTTHPPVLPALGISAEPKDETPRERASQITSHVVYGVATELVRSFVRKLL